MHPEAERLIIALDLGRHPEGGWYRETWRSELKLATPQGERAAATSIHYLLADGAVSHFHRLTADEVWYLHAGGPVDIRLLDDQGERTIRLDADSETPSYQAVVEAGTWFGAELADPSGYALLGCAVAPGFAFADFELGQFDDLIKDYPAAKDLITRLTPERGPI